MCGGRVISEALYTVCLLAFILPSELVVASGQLDGVHCCVHDALADLAKDVTNVWHLQILPAKSALSLTVFADWVDQRVCHFHKQFGALETKDHALAVLVHLLVFLGRKDCRKVLETSHEIKNERETLVDDRVDL